jgi:hypothetical protein
VRYRYLLADGRIVKASSNTLHTGATIPPSRALPSQQLLFLSFEFGIRE